MLTEPVKRGDVLVRSRKRQNDQYKLVTVKQVTSKNIWAGGETFTLDGFSIASQYYELHHLTPELEAKAKRQSTIDFMTSFPWNRMSDELLDEVADFMRSRGFDNF